MKKADHLHTRVKVTRVDLLCPRCSVGESRVVMRATGTTRTSYPATHQHVCPHCDYSEFTTDIFPRMDTTPDVDVSNGLIRLLAVYGLVLGAIALVVSLIAIL